MKQLKGSTRKYLRGQAHHLKPVVMVGKNGLTDDVIGAIDEALDSFELIKVKFIEFKKERKELSEKIAERTRAEFLGTIGNIAMFFRQHPDEEQRKISLPVE